MVLAWVSLVSLHQSEAVFQHFFGPPAVGFGVGLLSVHRRFPVATSIVSRRASRWAGAAHRAVTRMAFN